MQQHKKKTTRQTGKSLNLRLSQQTRQIELCHNIERWFRYSAN